MTTVVGFSASLRNARFGLGTSKLISELGLLQSEHELVDFLQRQTKIRSEDFLEAGRREGKPFDELFRSLGKLRGDRGLSNSEASLAAALWGALREGAEIDHVPLAAHFPPSGKVRDSTGLKRRIMAADAIICSGPVYFGDRGSLAQSLFDFINSDLELRESIQGKIYGGIAVGAKRNGGQETTLIYQMLDMIQLGALAVGNGHETTAQYGGTAVAGDVGTLAKDAYGLETCIGTGRRVAKIATMHKAGNRGESLVDKLKLQIWLLQDAEDRRGLRYFLDAAQKFEKRHPFVDASVLDATDSEVVRCIACDICPTRIGDREEYRCIITAKDDFFVKHHRDLTTADAILVAAYSPEDRTKLRSVYQQFIERTRYLRRDNYVFDDLLAAPFVISEIEARQHLHIRMATSIIRHQTVLHRPIIGYIQNGIFLNEERFLEASDSFVQTARELLVGRYRKRAAAPSYNPVGYEISLAKTEEDHKSGAMANALNGITRARSTAARRRVQE